jgi:cyclophilin family peptidyl-prolyl cis-trans isomerase
MTKTITYTSIVLAIVVAGFIYYFTSADTPSQSSDLPPIGSLGTNQSVGQNQPVSISTPPTPQQQSTPPLSNSSDQKSMQATLHTTKGDVTIAFSPEIAPNTVANFIKLAKEGFYNGVKFHRVIKDFMIQAGDPLSKDDSKMSSWGTGGPGYKFADEITPESKNSLGTIAMANSGKNTNGSQFYINAKDNNFLDGGYTVFGKVIKGLDIVLAIDTVPTDSSDRPITPVVINSITVE